MLPNKKNIIRDIMPAGAVSNKPLLVSKKEPEKPKEKYFSAPEFPRFGDFGRLKFILAAVLIYTVSILAVDIFAKTIVTVVLKSDKFDVDASFGAGGADSEIPAEGVLFEETVESSAKATGEKEFNDRAMGQIVIYNAYSSEVQQLVERTRFSTPDDKIFRIQKAIAVPGAKVIDGKIEPSSVEADAVADSPGERYNIGFSAFSRARF